jgi:DNA-binding response OmpR family regulator
MALKVIAVHKFDLFLLDSWLPDGSGIDLCKAIRQIDAHTPIIFYSAAAYEDDKVLAIGAGAQGYLTKPARLAELCDLVSSLIHDAPTKKSGSTNRTLPEIGFSWDTDS